MKTRKINTKIFKNAMAGRKYTWLADELLTSKQRINYYFNTDVYTENRYNFFVKVAKILKIDKAKILK